MTALSPVSRFAADLPSHDVGVTELFFSMTDGRGIIRQVNDVFVRLSRHGEDDLIGSPHNIIRHPDMPGGIFRTIWRTLQAGQPFATAGEIYHAMNGVEHGARERGVDKRDSAEQGAGRLGEELERRRQGRPGEGEDSGAHAELLATVHGLHEVLDGFMASQQRIVETASARARAGARLDEETTATVRVSTEMDRLDIAGPERALARPATGVDDDARHRHRPHQGPDGAARRAVPGRGAYPFPHRTSAPAHPCRTGLPGRHGLPRLSSPGLGVVGSEP